MKIDEVTVAKAIRKTRQVISFGILAVTPYITYTSAVYANSCRVNPGIGGEIFTPVFLGVLAYIIFPKYRIVVMDKRDEKLKIKLSEECDWCRAEDDSVFIMDQDGKEHKATFKMRGE